MKNKEKKSFRSKWDTAYLRLLSGTIFAVVVVFFVISSTHAGPITGGLNNPPFAKMSVYQGVLSIVPADNSNVMEIGNTGRDIASTGDIYIRPGGMDTASSNYAKFYKDGTVTSLSIPGVVNGGQLCINGDCRSAWGSGAGTYLQHFIGNLAENSTTPSPHARASHYEVARIGYVPDQWTSNTSVFVELHEKYWGSGGYKKYEVWAGYYNDYGIHLIEATASKKQPTTMPEVKAYIGNPVATGQNLGGPTHPAYYISVFVDVDNYTSWDVIISHNMTETSNTVPNWNQIHYFDTPAGTDINSFSEADVVANTFTTSFGPQDDRGAGGAVEGGELQLQGAVSSTTTYNTWHLDTFQDRFRIFDTTERLSVAGNGDVKIWGGQLCFGDNTCKSSWNGIGGGSLDATLTIDNKSQKDLILGQDPNGSYTDTSAKLRIVQPLSGHDGLEAIMTASGNTSAIYGENASTTGWAGFFSGRVNITNDGTTPGELCLGGTCKSAWPMPTLQNVLLAGNTSQGQKMSLNSGTNAPQATLVASMPNTDHVGSANDTIDAYNNVAGGNAIYAKAEIASAYAGYFSGRLMAVNNNADPAKYGSALIAAGASTGIGNPSYAMYGIAGSAAIEAWGGMASSGVTTYGIFAGAGDNSGGGTNYAGYFVGRTAFTGVGSTVPMVVTKGGLDVVSVIKINTGVGNSTNGCNSMCAPTMQCAMAFYGNTSTPSGNYGCQNGVNSFPDSSTYLWCYCF